jgi:hypothetical protein
MHSVTDDTDLECIDPALTEEGFQGYPYPGSVDEDDAGADKSPYQSDGPDDAYESVDEMDIFGEWFNEDNEDRPYKTPMLEDLDSPKWDEEDIQDVSAVGQSCTSPFPHSTLPLPPAPATPTFRERYKDLVTGVLGVQVSANAEMVSWTSGQRTVLPYLENGSRARTKNVLQQDRDYVADLARAPEALPFSDLVVFLSKDTEEEALLQAAREALSRNKTVVVRGYVDTKGFELTEEELWKRYSIFVDRPVEPQGMLYPPSSKTS